MLAAGLAPRLLVDCSHANSGKQHQLQRHVLRNVIQQRLDGAASIVGFMLESNIYEGNQRLAEDPSQLEYGVSITDSCMGWEETERIIRYAHSELVRGRQEGW
jgi:3-deoxy-7-phosphoheptulonate synthase